MTLAITLSAMTLSSMSTKLAIELVPATFDVPGALETADFRLRMLTVNDVVKDFDAVMSSAGELRNLWPHSTWPEGLTLEQNLIDLGWHQKEFQRRSSFTYTVVQLDESRVIGCVYIYPCLKAGYDAQVYFWTRPAQQITDVQPGLLEHTVKNWLSEVWPFQKPAFPGLDVPWDEWNALPDKVIS